MEEKISAGIEQYFSDLEDPRVDRTKLHKQVDILVIAVCAVASQAWVRESNQFNARMIDAAIVADHLILAAANLGLGTCRIAAFNVKAALVSTAPVGGCRSSLLYPAGLSRRPAAGKNSQATLGARPL